MKTSMAGLNIIKRSENFSPVVYICPAGHPTIGWGHVVLPGEIFTEITEKQGEIILASDVGIAERAIIKLVKAPLQQEHFDALVSFTFNLGEGNLQKSTLRSKLNKLEYEAVPAEFKKWCFSNGKKLAGLIVRRKAEADLFDIGTKKMPA